MSFFKRLKEGLSKSSNKISTGISDIIKKKKLDQETLDELEELLISSDLGPQTSANIIENFAKGRFGKDVSDEEVKQALSEEIAKILEPHAKKLEPSAEKPYTIMFVGVNGTGKTTTIGKIASRFKENGKNITIAACDTFRAAAVEQLETWANRSNSQFFRGEENADPASVAFRAYEGAKNDGNDILMIDTAGRLQNKSALMEELAKMSRVLKKHSEGLPHETILVLDATTGQNAVSQAEIFKEIADITGIIITKLDGSAKGGIIVSLADRFKLPIYAVGVGESIEDLKEFDAKAFADALVGL